MNGTKSVTVRTPWFGVEKGAAPAIPGTSPDSVWLSVGCAVERSGKVAPMVIVNLAGGYLAPSAFTAEGRGESTIWTQWNEDPATAKKQRLLHVSDIASAMAGAQVLVVHGAEVTEFIEKLLESRSVRIRFGDAGSLYRLDLQGGEGKTKMEQAAGKCLPG